MQDYEEDKPVVPPLSLVEVGRWRHKLMDMLMPGLYNTEIRGSTFTALVDAICGLLRTNAKAAAPAEAHIVVNTSMRQAVCDTLMAHALGITLDVAAAQRVAGVIAGNVAHLRAGRAVPTWKSQAAPEWAMVKVIDVYPYLTPRKHIWGTMLVIEVLTGPASTCTFRQFFTDGMLRRLARQIGVRSKKMRTPVHPREFVMTYVLVKLKKGDKLELERYLERQSLSDRNTARTTQRMDYQARCPIKSKWPCVFCRTGYNSCKLGTHPENFGLMPCHKGHDGWLDYRHPHSLCLSCQLSAWKSKYGGYYVEKESTDGTSSSA